MGVLIRYLSGLFWISYLQPIFVFHIIVVLGSYMIMRTVCMEEFQERLPSPITVVDFVQIAFARGVPIFITGVCVGLTVELSILCFPTTFGLLL